MADKITGVGKKPLTKEQMKARNQRRANMERRAMLFERRSVALSNSRERNRIMAGYDDFDYNYDYRSNSSAPTMNNSVPEVDHRFIADMQKVKFCRKPIGFMMMLVFIVAIAVVALSFVDLGVPMIDQFTAMFAETEPKAEVKEDAEGEDEESAEETEAEENPANADEEGAEGSDTVGEGEDVTAGEEGTGEETEEESKEATGTYYKFSDAVFGWIAYMAKLFGTDLSLGESAWYDMQIAKVETGMADNFAGILIQAFPGAIVLYLLFALVLVIKTLICWASRDRRIFRRTGIECFIMIILAGVVALGGFASTVEIDAKMEFGNIVNFLIGMITGTGGFTAGYGLLIMIALPLIGLILSFFLLEKKLRSREITQPIIMYEYRESLREAKARKKRR